MLIQIRVHQLLDLVCVPPQRPGTGLSSVWVNFCSSVQRNQLEVLLKNLFLLDDGEEPVLILVVSGGFPLRSDGPDPASAVRSDQNLILAAAGGAGLSPQRCWWR